MRDIDISAKAFEVEYEELTADDRRLVEEARKATFRSYAPYSHFSVGAAIRLDNGQIVTGSNQENAAYPSGLCAERTAAFYAHSQYPEAKFQAIAIAARGTAGDFTPWPISPCGACRQVLLEYETLAKRDVRVLLASNTRVIVIDSVRSLLPFAFTDF